MCIAYKSIEILPPINFFELEANILRDEVHSVDQSTLVPLFLLQLRKFELDAKK